MGFGSVIPAIRKMFPQFRIVQHQNATSACSACGNGRLGTRMSNKAKHRPGIAPRSSGVHDPLGSCPHSTTLEPFLTSLVKTSLILPHTTQPQIPPQCSPSARVGPILAEHLRLRGRPTQPIGSDLSCHVTLYPSTTNKLLIFFFFLTLLTPGLGIHSFNTMVKDHFGLRLSLDKVT